MSEIRAIPKSIHRFKDGVKSSTPDLVAVEEPMELRLGYGPADNRQQRSVAVTMRTPGNDLELAIGFLFSEGILSSLDSITHIDHCTDDQGDRTTNVVRAELDPSIKLDWSKLERNFYTNSSCGICGKASIESIEEMCPNPISSDIIATSKTILGLNKTMREAQQIFEHTGGLHAAALFDSLGQLIHLREDIGRHNALDKLIGTSLFEKRTPLSNNIVMLSGRCCFELVQKCAMAGVAIIVAVGAPSSLAVETADALNITIIGFLKTDGFNIYSHNTRIKEL